MKRARSSKAAKWKPEIENAFVTWAPIDRGQLIYVLYVPNHMSPLGFVWGRIRGEGRESTFETNGSFVQIWARRFGVRTRINLAIFDHVSTITTAHGNKEGGLAFIKSQGYKWDSNANCWYLKKPRRKK
jgi:hypothetical protein